jgi:hypothetical protein
VALFRHIPTTTCRSVTIGQAIGQISCSTAVNLPAVAAASGQSGHPDRRRAPEPASSRHKRSAGKEASCWSALGP